MSRFIFMLTKDDVTVGNAREIVAELAESSLKHIGCKDVGLDRTELSALVSEIHERDRAAYLEIVSLERDGALRAAQTGAALGFDFVIGGLYNHEVARVLSPTRSQYFPYVGEVSGHPCVLSGAVEDIVAEAAEVERRGADGINLLAYRYDGDVLALVELVQRHVSLPVICAGAVDSLERVGQLVDRHVWGFTIGTAVLDGVIVPGASLLGQVEAVLARASAYGSETAK